MRVELDDENEAVVFDKTNRINLPRLYRAYKEIPEKDWLKKLITSVGIETLNFCENYTKHYQPKEGEIVLDVGAHVGGNTEILSDMVGETGHVIAMEPDFRALGCLTANMFDRDNVTILPYAAWNCNDIIPIYFRLNTMGISSVVVHQGKEAVWTPVRAKTIDFVIKEQRYDKVNFIKMDIEGGEEEAFKGMTETLKTVDAMAIAAYHVIDNPIKHRTCSVLMPFLHDMGFDVVMEYGNDGEIIYANRSL